MVKHKFILFMLLFITISSLFSQSIEIDDKEVSICDSLTVTSAGDLFVDPDGEDGPQQPLLRITEAGGIEIFYVGKYRSLEEAVIGMVDPETIDEKSIVVDGGIVTGIEPGVYNNITFTGNGTMGIGKYIVYGDFIINQGVTVTIDNINTESDIYDFFGEEGYANREITHTSTSYGSRQYNGGSGYYGGGNGGSGEVYISRSAPDVPFNYRYGGDGAGGPCGSTPQAGGTYAWGGGWIQLDAYGIFNNLGQMIANGIGGGEGDSSIYDDGGGSGGYICIRTHSTSIYLGSMSCNGGNGGSDAKNGGGGGGGVIEIYYYDDESGDPESSFSVAKGARGIGTTDGTVRFISSQDFLQLYSTGAQSDDEDYSEDPDMGIILEMLGGWLVDEDDE